MALSEGIKKRCYYNNHMDTSGRSNINHLAIRLFRCEQMTDLSIEMPAFLS